jgi:hypothetical protein
MEALKVVQTFFTLAEGTEREHNPFRNWSHLGDHSPEQLKGHDRKNDWECLWVEPYHQECYPKDSSGKVDWDAEPVDWYVDPADKAAYNHEYKTGHAKGKYVRAWRSGNRKSGLHWDPNQGP